MKLFAMSQLCLVGTCLLMSSIAMAQQPDGTSGLQTTLEQSAQGGKFTFVVFSRDQGEATQRFYQQNQEGLASYGDKVAITSAHVDGPADRALVEKLGIARAPMPMTVVIAPNGAVTGLFPRSINAEQIAASIVPPTMMRCMKELQEQKLVFVCLTRTESVDVPEGVKQVQQLPQFQGRISLVGMRLDDPAEARFYEQMKVSAPQIQGPYAVLIAPPGVLIGHYNNHSSADQIAAAIHKAGQCCEDDKCKHNHAPQATGSRPNPR
ncbi:MAG TPA: hypothetical protein VNQ76_05630 [Planctomicrobium sp.]|nr:hypothetical protein [Planctomicrobium sp.]